MHNVTIKTAQELEIIREGGKRLAKILDKLCRAVKPGVTTEELDVSAERRIREQGGEPAFKGYKPRPDHPAFTTTICLSLNEEVVHAPAVPSRVIRDGDLVKIDIGMRWPAHNLPRPSLTSDATVRSPTETSDLREGGDRIGAHNPPLKIRGGIGGVMSEGFYTDTARTVIVGKADKKLRELVKVTEKALRVGIKQVRAGRRISHISKAIEKFVEKYGYGVVRDLVGHGVGYRVHEPPEIPNFWVEGFPDTVLQEGMVLAIEPMVNLGSWRVRIQPDGWTIVTDDGKPSAHFEHTVIVRKRGAEVVTR